MPQKANHVEAAIRRQSDEAMRAKLENLPSASEAVLIFLLYPAKQNEINEYVSVDKHLAGLNPSRSDDTFCFPLYVCLTPSTSEGRGRA